MSPPFCQLSPLTHSTAFVINVSRCDRWRISYRLQELMIPCWCLEDGSLKVEVHNGITAILVRSVVQQFLSSRTELVDWLEQCWNVNN